MARSGTQANENASQQYSNYESNAVNNYNQAMQGYNANLGGMLAQGNPYTSKGFLQNQNKLTSAAMNSQNDAANQQLQDTALRTGTNTAALGNTEKSIARQGQRTLDQYNAQAANDNEDKYLQYEQGLLGDQLRGADSEAGMYGSSISGENNANSNLINAQGQEEGLWGNAIGAAGAAGAAAI